MVAISPLVLMCLLPALPLLQIDKNVEREIVNHRQLSGHPNIVRFFDVFLTTTHLGIAMEYAAGGELFDRIVKAGRFTEDEARYFFQQLISGVAWCHREVRVLHENLAACWASAALCAAFPAKN